MFEQFKELLKKHELFPTNQLGGRMGFWAEALALQTSDEIRNTIGKQELAAMVLTDFADEFRSIAAGSKFIAALV